MELEMRVAMELVLQFCPWLSDHCDHVAAYNCTVSNNRLVWLDVCFIARIPLSDYVRVLLFILHLLQAIFCKTVKTRSSFSAQIIIDDYFNLDLNRT